MLGFLSEFTHWLQLQVGNSGHTLSTARTSKILNLSLLSVKLLILNFHAVLYNTENIQPYYTFGKLNSQNFLTCT